MFWVWIGVIVVTAIVEFATLEVVSIWFTLGAIIPFIMAATNCVNWWIQILVFIALSTCFILALRPFAKKFLNKGDNKTNLDAYIGQEFTLLKRTDEDEVGQIKINDVVWGAIDEQRRTIEKGDKVRVLRVAGNKMIVEKISKKSDKKKGE